MNDRDELLEYKTIQVKKPNFAFGMNFFDTNPWLVFESRYLITKEWQVKVIKMKSLYISGKCRSPVVDPLYVIFICNQYKG